MLLIFLTSLILLIAGIIEKQRHSNRLRNIPIRIHINGTRGKSLLTRMIVDLFLNEGRSVVAKVTGESPLIFSPKIQWNPWRRGAPPRIKENLRFIKKIFSEKPQILVIENMALAPENLHTSETCMIQSTLSVFTNFRPDHHEVMGIHPSEIVQALTYAFPVNGKLLIPENELSPQIIKQASELKNKLIPARVSSGSNKSTIPGVFNASFALLEQVGEINNISTDAFTETVHTWQKKLQSQQFLIDVPDTSRKLINLFTCNDVISAKELVTSLEESDVIYPPYDVILTCRIDRPLRTIVFLNWIITELTVRRVVLAGVIPTLAVKRVLKKSEKPMNTIFFNHKIHPKQIFSIFNDNENNILGLGNYVKTGEKILAYAEKE